MKVAACTLLLLALPFVASAQSGLEVLPVQGNVFAIFGPGGNTTVQVGSQGAVVVDTQPAALSAQVLEAIGRLSSRPIRHIILTNGSDQNAGGAANLAKAGRYVRVIDSFDPRGADTRSAIMAHVNVLNRMTDSKVPSDSWPTDTYNTDEWSLFVNGEAVQLFHIPDAQTDGDTIVFFRRSDVISAGALFNATAYPRFDPKAGGSIDGIIEGLSRILDITVPGENQEGGTVVVPGRGRLSDETDVANYRDMVIIIRDRIRSMVAKGASLEEVSKLRPTRDYDGIYSNREWSGDMFTEAIYRDLSGRSNKDRR
jgi:glyoxylase-like metal-dependent hydrolase (beta-lactamase superfamily II)